MAHAFRISSQIAADPRGFSYWMNRVLAELHKLQDHPDPDTVHDLRVALRRCRSVAAAVQEIDPYPDWQDLRDRGRKLFRALGDLRDAHVMADWINELQPESDLLKVRMLASLTQSEETAQRAAIHRAESFNQHRWKELDHTLSIRLRRIPPDGDAAHCLALERLEEAKELHRHALRTENPEPWHILRIAVKRFRYTVESLLPAAHAEWGESLKKVQDALGNIHDLDVLKAIVKKQAPPDLADAAEGWNARVDRARNENMLAYRQMALGQASVWQVWLSGFPRKDWLVYGTARINAMRRAMDRGPGRSLAVARLAKKLASQLAKLGVCDSCRDSAFRRSLETAARLTGIRISGEARSRDKAVRKFLLDAPLPPGWRPMDWERVAWSLRFKRGPAPSEKHRRFSRLPAEQRAAITQTVGILRLAIALRKEGITSGSSLKLESLPQRLTLVITTDSNQIETSPRVESSKALLETSLGKTIVIRSETPEDSENANSAARGPQLVAQSA